MEAAEDIGGDEEVISFAGAHNQRFEIDKEIIDEYRNANLTWVSIAKLLVTTTETLYQWRKRNDYVDPGIMEVTITVNFLEHRVQRTFR